MLEKSSRILYALGEVIMYLYIHGLNSDRGSRSYLELSAFLPNTKDVSYDYRLGADTCFAHLRTQIESYLKEAKELGEELKIIGSSLGGFWALQVAKKYNLPCLAINPVVYAHKQLRPFLGKNENFYTHEAWELTEELLASYETFLPPKNFLTRPFILLGQEDEILDYSLALNEWLDEAFCILTKDMHSIFDYVRYKRLFENF